MGWMDTGRFFALQITTWSGVVTLVFLDDYE